MNLSSFMRQLVAERKKRRRRRLILLPAVFLFFQALWGIWQLHGASQEELQSGYVMMFHHLPIMNTILLPMMAAVTASRLCDMEIKGDTLKILYTMQKKTTFFDCKFLAGFGCLVLFTLGQGLMLLSFGCLYGFGEPLEWTMLFEYLAVTLFVSAVLLVLQQTLSLLSTSQLLPLAAGLTGCFLGLFSLFFPKAVARMLIWGYYAAFPVTAMDWNPSTRSVRYYQVPFPCSSFLLFLAAAAAIYWLCRYYFSRKEV